MQACLLGSLPAGINFSRRKQRKLYPKGVITMILDKTALSELTQGALRWEWDAEGFGTPLRLTPEQTDFYSRTESDFSRARASAGVCLECHTDADALSFEYCLSPGSSRDLWGFDLYLGRRLFAHTEGTLSARTPASGRCHCLKEKSIFGSFSQTWQSHRFGMWSLPGHPTHTGPSIPGGFSALAIPSPRGTLPIFLP